MTLTPLVKELQKGFILNKKDLYLAIKDNSDRMTSCNRHIFSIKLDGVCFSHNYTHQCENCGCLCGSKYIEAYKLGLKHGKENINE